MNPNRARIVGVAGVPTGHVLEFDGEESIVGRDPASDLVISDPAVSRRHCLIKREGESHRLTDLESRHGTYVNGQRVTDHLLAEEDRIAIGRSVLLYLGPPSERRTGSVSIELTDVGATVESTRQLPLDESLFIRPDRVFWELRESEKMAADLSALRKVSEAIRSIQETGALARRLLGVLFEVVPASRGGILLLDPESKPEDAVPTFDAVYTAAALEDGDERVQVSRTVAAQVIRERVATLSNGVVDAPAWAGARSLTDQRVRSVLAVPIALFERVIGVLYLDSSRGDAKFDDRHLELVTAVAGMVALPIASSHSDDSARRVSDALAETGEISDGVSAEVSKLLAEELATEPGATTQPAGQVTVLFRPQGAMHVGTAISLRGAASLVDPRLFPVTALFMDYGVDGKSTTGDAPDDAVLDRLAILNGSESARLVRVSEVTSIAQLATAVAATLPASDVSDAGAWFREILLASGLVVAGATHVIGEPAAVSLARSSNVSTYDPAADLELARALASRINKRTDAGLPRPGPVVAGPGDFLSLDGKGPMGCTARGAIYVSDSADEVARKIRTAKTDGRDRFDPTQELTAEVRNLLLLLHEVTDEQTTQTIERLTGQGYGKLKQELTDGMNAYLQPIRDRRLELAGEANLVARFERGRSELDTAGRKLAEMLTRLPVAAG